MVCSAPIIGCRRAGEQFAGLHGRQALKARGQRSGPARAEDAGLGDAGEGDGVGLMATQHLEMRLVLAASEPHMAT